MLPKTKAFLENALKEKQTSAAALYFRHQGKVTELYLGNHCYPEQGIERETAEDSLFDLASVTKILSTVSLLFSAESEQKISFQDPVQKYFSSFPSSEATILDLMIHRSGLPAHIEFFRRYEAGEAKFGDQKPILSWVCEAGLPNKNQQVYSDLGYMLLGLLLESIYGKCLPELFHEHISQRLKLENSGYVTLPQAPAPSRMYGLLAEPKRFVATEVCPWRKKTIQGEVHDDNTWAFGGYAGHAGLFSTARESAALFDHLWKKSKACPAFVQRKKEAPGIFSFGYMTYPGLRPFPGPAFADALGHTGFVGTSAWYQEETDTLAILLANRVHPSRSDTRWVQTRLELHKTLWEEAGL